MPNCPGAKFSGAKLSWCQIFRFYYLGAKLSVFIILEPNCPLYYLGAKLSGAKLSYCGSIRPAHNNFSFSKKKPLLTKYFPSPNLFPLSFFVPLLLRWPKLFLLFLGLSDPLLQCAILAALFHLTPDGLLLIMIWPKRKQNGTWWNGQPKSESQNTWRAEISDLRGTAYGIQYMEVGVRLGRNLSTGQR